MTETERLVLRPVEASHVPELAQLYRDPDISQWLWYGVWSDEQVQAWVTRQERGWRTDGVGKWMAYDRGSGELVGRGGLSLVDVDGERRLEVGWAVRQKLWRRGYATEIGRAGITFAREEMGADEVVAFTEVHNRASRLVMEKLGMDFSHEFRQPGLVEDDNDVHDRAPFVLYTIGLLPPRL